MFSKTLDANRSRTLADTAGASCEPFRPPHGSKRVPLLFGMVALLAALGTGCAGQSANGSGSKVSASLACSQDYPDKQKGDVCPDASGMATLAGLTLTAKPLTLQPDSYGGTQSLCAAVTIANNSGKSQDYNVLSFKMRPPSGDVGTANTLSLAGTLHSGVLVNGGTTSGDVCTPYKGEQGRYILIYKPGAFRADRVTWISTVAGLGSAPSPASTSGMPPGGTPRSRDMGVVTGQNVVLRSGPGGNYSVLGAASPGTTLTITCAVYGQRVASDRLWLYTNRGWIAEQAIDTGAQQSAVSSCAGNITGPTAGGGLPDGARGPFPVLTLGGAPAQLHAGPSNSSMVVRSRVNGDLITIACSTTGDRVDGPGGPTNDWDRLPDGTWIADAVLDTHTNGSPATRC